MAFSDEIHPSQKDIASAPTGARDYRAWVGQPQRYDISAAMQFNLLTTLGLREYHALLDIGCGSLRGGRLFIPYLLPEHYFGVEPEKWLVEEGIRNEIGQDLIRIKRPTFRHEANFELTAFDRSFDFILAQSIFSHAALGQIARCMDQAARVMHAGSLFIVNYLQADQDYLGTEWLYPGCSTFKPETIARQAAQHGLHCHPIDYFHPSKLSWAILTPRSDYAPPSELLFHRTAGK